MGRSKLKEPSDRNKLILAQFREEPSFAKIAEEFKITRQRVEQILSRWEPRRGERMHAQLQPYFDKLPAKASCVLCRKPGARFICPDCRRALNLIRFAITRLRVAKATLHQTHNATQAAYQIRKLGLTPEDVERWG